MTDQLTTDLLREKILSGVTATHVDVVDVSDGCGSSFEATIVSSAFEGLSTLKRHRLVNAALVNEMPRIHAFTQVTLTPEQWKERSAASQ